MSFTKISSRFHSLLALLVLIVAASVVVGWILQDPFLVQIHPSFAPMVINTAISFLFIAIGLFLSDYGYIKTGRVLAISVFVFAFLVFIQYPLGIDLGIDTLFLKPFEGSGVVVGGRMSASTAISMMVIAVGLFFNKQTSVCQYVRATCASLAFGLGLIGFCGYFLRFSSEYGWGNFSRMAIHTAICFIFLSLSLLLKVRAKIRQDNPPIGYFVPFYMLFVGILTSLLIWQLLVVKDFDRNRRITSIRADALKTNIDNSFYPLVTSLENMAHRFALKRYKNLEMWELDAESFVQDFNGLRRITWVDADFVTRWVFPKNNHGQLVLNLNILLEPSVRQTVETVMRSRTSAVSPSVELKSGGRGIILFSPIYRDDVFFGMVSVALAGKPFFERIANIPGYDLTILEDGSELISTGKPDSVYSRDWTYHTRYQNLKVDWELVLTPKLELIRANASVVPAFVLLFGVTISILLSIAVRFYQRSKEAERKVRETLEWQNAGRNSISLLVISTDSDLRIRDVNASALKVLGYSAEELVGRETHFFVDREEVLAVRGKLEERLARRLETPRAFAEAHFELGYHDAQERTLITKSGKRIATVASFSQVKDDQGRIAGYMAIFEDVTQKKQREKLLQEQEKMIKTSSRLASLGEMAAGVAHEINNPLTIISGYVSVLRKNLAQKGLGGDVELNRRMDSIEATVQRIAKIIRGLRTYARESHGGDDEVVNIDLIIDDTLAICQEKFKNNEISLLANIEPNLQIKCRPYQISQVILNLLNNAYDAVSGEATRIVAVEAKRVSDGVEVSVTDSGSGVSPELREKIMQPFFTTKEVGKGMGLGLSISTGIIHGHGGKFYLDSNHAKTRFVIWLPA
ncbi:ATP-binding protein [Bdellovibrio svalbardensis]|uniref:histidine kinase n=1 Tax=Bdellovibrio svalbardensis TaxID=2972972 RepID=A0ABT6DKP8_9BACT|nr:ATP-binding protein [Bdellovibrio svalbardensis]MDG0817451.1 ATP-binding protein [Bdellovibrio svalbardensis]